MLFRSWKTPFHRLHHCICCLHLCPDFWSRSTFAAGAREEYLSQLRCSSQRTKYPIPLAGPMSTQKEELIKILITWRWILKGWNLTMNTSSSPISVILYFGANSDIPALEKHTTLVLLVLYIKLCFHSSWIGLFQF